MIKAKALITKKMILKKEKSEGGEEREDGS